MMGKRFEVLPSYSIDTNVPTGLDTNLSTLTHRKCVLELLSLDMQFIEIIAYQF